LDDEQVAPLLRDSDLAPESSRIRGDGDGVFLERVERNDLKRPFMGGRQHYVGGRAVLVRPQPVHRGHAPAVAGREPREVVLRHGGDQVVADTTLVLEERGRDHRADRVAPAVLRTGTTAPVPVKAGEGVDATRLKLATEHITIGHRTSIAWQASRCRTGSALNYGYGKVRFTAPVPVGSSVRMRLRLAAVEATDRGVRVTYHQSFEIDGGQKPVCIADSIFFYWRR